MSHPSGAFGLEENLYSQNVKRKCSMFEMVNRAIDESSSVWGFAVRVYSIHLQDGDVGGYDS